MQHFLLEYGLVAIFLCALLETDVSFVLTGVVMHLGTEHPTAAFIVMLAGALCHDTVWFLIGRNRSAMIRGSKLYQRVGPMVERLVARFGVWELLVCRFVYGTRNPSLLFWGIYKLPWAKFLAIEALGLTVWGAALASLGYFLSDRAEELMGQVARAERWLLFSIVAAFVVFWSVRFCARTIIAWRNERRVRGDEREIEI